MYTLVQQYSFWRKMITKSKTSLFQVSHDQRLILPLHQMDVLLYNEIFNNTLTNDGQFEAKQKMTQETASRQLYLYKNIIKEKLHTLGYEIMNKEIRAFLFSDNMLWRNAHYADMQDRNEKEMEKIISKTVMNELG